MEVVENSVVDESPKENLLLFGFCFGLLNLMYIEIEVKCGSAGQKWKQKFKKKMHNI